MRRTRSVGTSRASACSQWRRTNRRREGAIHSFAANSTRNTAQIAHPAQRSAEAVPGETSTASS